MAQRLEHRKKGLSTKRTGIHCGSEVRTQKKRTVNQGFTMTRRLEHRTVNQEDRGLSPPAAVSEMLGNVCHPQDLPVTTRHKQVIRTHCLSLCLRLCTIFSDSVLYQSKSKTILPSSCAGYHKIEHYTEASHDDISPTESYGSLIRCAGKQ